MTGMAHEAPRPARSSAVTAAWAVLVGMGGTSVTYNVYHAVHHGSMNLGLALLYGIAPVFAAALLSHIVAEHDGGRFLQAVTFAVMLGAMTLSIGATAAVVKPAAGPWMQWLFGAVLDAAALVALRVILTGRKRKAEAAMAMEAAERTVAEAERIAAEAAGSVAEAEQKAAEIEAEALAAKDAVQAELTRVSTELAAANATVEALRSRRGSPRKSSRSSGRKRTTASPLNSGPSSPPETNGGSPPETESAAEADTEAQALMILAAEPDISGSKLGLRLGKSERYGCILKNKLAPASDQG
jgi:hypothetical protein